MTMINGKGVSIVPGDWEQEFKKSKEYKILVAVSVIGFIIAVILPIIILIR